MTQHATAAKMALFQAETAANIPWHGAERRGAKSEGVGSAPMKTWTGLEAGIKAANVSAGDGWSGYEPIDAAAVAGIIDVTGSADAKRVYAWLRSADSTGLGAAAFPADPTFNIVPGTPVR
jgi:hypothetical protein